MSSSEYSSYKIDSPYLEILTCLFSPKVFCCCCCSISQVQTIIARILSLTMLLLSACVFNLNSRVTETWKFPTRWFSEVIFKAILFDHCCKVLSYIWRKPWNINYFLNCIKNSSLGIGLEWISFLSCLKLFRYFHVAHAFLENPFHSVYMHVCISKLHAIHLKDAHL